MLFEGVAAPDCSEKYPFILSCKASSHVKPTRYALETNCTHVDELVVASPFSANVLSMVHISKPKIPL